MATRLRGKVETLIADREGAVIVLDNDPAVGPKDNSWRLERTHANYNALYSLALAGFANRWRIVLRIAGNEQIDPAREAIVAHLGVDEQSLKG
jgi:hypothetical protein